MISVEFTKSSNFETNINFPNDALSDLNNLTF